MLIRDDRGKVLVKDTSSNGTLINGKRIRRNEVFCIARVCVCARVCMFVCARVCCACMFVCACLHVCVCVCLARAPAW